MFDNLMDELQYSLKGQKCSDRVGSTTPLQTNIGETSQEIS